MARILLVEDNRSLLEGLAETLIDDDVDITLTENGAQAREAFEGGDYAVVISDLKLPDITGVDLLEAFKAKRPDVVFLVITAFGTVEVAVEAMKRGAFDFILKPFTGDEIKQKFRKALEQYELQQRVQVLTQETEVLREQVQSRFNTRLIVGDSAAMNDIDDVIERVAPSSTAVLITGETGTGKELVARAIHERSQRRDHPFVPVNCAVFADSLVESELFGHEKGAFTGADRQKRGRFELADGGSIFLDEVGELSGPVQAKLLRVLQEREFERVGGSETVRCDIRLIAATNRNLEEEIKKGTFREDLYFRLNVIPIHLPALRERKDDIPLLTSHFLERFSRENHKKVDGFHEDAMARMLAYNWPGNVRELENVVERGVVLTRDPWIDSSLLPFAEPAEPARENNLTAQVEDHEQRLIRRALADAGGNATKAAEKLGVSRSTLRYKIEKYNIQ
jgi:DNA-binding NtrC family response regulator